jgi:hypothetical protein
MTTKSKVARRSVARPELLGQFNDYASENPKLSFDAVAKKALGANPFPKTPNGGKFRDEYRKAFDLERAT